jgi:hypothetical protein
MTDFYNVARAMRALGTAVLLSLLTMAPARGQNQDSLMFDKLNKGLITNDDVFLIMYVQGRLSHTDLFVSSPAYRERFYEKRAKFIRALREQLRYKSTVNYLESTADTTYQAARPEPKEDSQSDFSVVSSEDPRVVEAFVLLGRSYRMYRCPSFDGQEDFRLLTTGPGDPFKSLDLFAADTALPVRLDSFAVTRPGGSGAFSFDTLNGGNILRVADSSSGDVHSETNLHLLAVRNGKFIDLFHCATSEVFVDENAATHRVMRQITYEDVDHDGFRDILETVTDDIVMPGAGHEADVSHAKVISRVATQKGNFLWRSSTLSFELMPSK